MTLENENISLLSILDYEHKFANQFNEYDLDNARFNSNVNWTLKSHTSARQGSFKLFNIMNPSLKRILCYVALENNRKGTPIPHIFIDLRSSRDCLDNRIKEVLDNINNWITLPAFEKIMKVNIVSKHPMATLNINCII